MNIQYISKLEMPDSPGVYIFRDGQKRPLYIGRATILRDRVRSYFSSDLIETRGPRIVDMVTKAKSLTWQETGSVLEAVILESRLIKKYQPYYNVDERDDKSSLYVVITKEDWPRVLLERVRDFDRMKSDGTLDYEVRRFFGPFPHAGIIKESLKILRRLFPFRDKKSADPRHDNFYRSLAMSPNILNEDAKEEYERTIEHLILFFDGKKRRLLSELRTEMRSAADNLKFEQASRYKKLIYALDHINDVALLKRTNNGHNRDFRIEAFDVAHLSGIENVGAMAVSVDGQLSPSDYRKFKISRDKANDVAGLVEILSRRLNHPEWDFPDLIVVDGNEVMIRAAEAVLMSRRIAIPVVAVTKDEHHKADRLSGNPDLIKSYRNEIISVNAEVHRFAISYHRRRREKRWKMVR